MRKSQSDAFKANSWLDLALQSGGLMAWQTDLATGRTTASDSAEALWGFRDGPPDAFRERIHPEDRARVEQAWSQAVASGGDYRIEYRVLHPQGERVYETRARVLRDAGGQPTHLVGITSDVTAERRAQREREELQARLRHLADAMPQIVWVTDPQGNTVYLNQAWSEATGRPASEGLDWRWLELVHPDDRGPLTNARAECLRAGSIYEAEYRLACRDGWRWHCDRGVPIRDEAGDVTRWYGSSSDIHELKTATERLQEMDRRKNEFLATLSHELRNPLAPIGYGLDLLRRERNKPEVQERTRCMIERQVNQLVRLVDELLDLGRIETGKIELKRATLPLAQVLDSAIEAAQPGLEAKGLALAVECTSAPVLVDADADRLAQALGNVVNNAVKYTGAGGHIRITLNAEGNTAIVAVADDGAGIPPDMLHRIFDLFAQACRPIEKTGGGLGIGLNVAQQLIGMHGGTITAHSDGPGRGSCFEIRLPIASRAS